MHLHYRLYRKYNIYYFVIIYYTFYRKYFYSYNLIIFNLKQ